MTKKTRKSKNLEKKLNKCKTLEEILASDDELSTDNIAIPYVAAYKDDSRFENIEAMKNNTESFNKLTKMNCEEIEHYKMQQLKNSSSTLLMKGYLSRKDTYCFLCLERTTNKQTLLWLLNFLTFKDLQCNYKFLISCLVPSYDEYYSFAGSSSLNVCYESNHGLKVIVY